MWLIFALSSAFAVSLRNVFTRKLVAVADDDMLLCARYVVVAALAVVPVAIGGFIVVSGDFYWAVVGAGIAELLAYVCLFKALRNGELGSTFPLVAFTPIFMVATSYFILGELPNLSGFTGIGAIVVGAYTMRIESLNGGVFAPIKALASESAARYMLWAAFLFSFAASFYKRAILASSPVTSLFVSQAFAAVVLAVWCIGAKRLGRIALQMSKNYRMAGLLGLAAFAEGIMFVIAINLALAPYVISVKRMSILFTILLGFLIFQEKNFGRSLLAGAVMVIGIILISMA